MTDFSKLNDYIEHIKSNIQLEDNELSFTIKYLNELYLKEDNESKYRDLYYLQKHLCFQRNIPIGDYSAWYRKFN